MSVETAPRRRRLEPDARRGQILACAVRLFGERPYADVSTTDVAREAGVARGLVNHYFGAKKDLYLEVVRVMVTIPEVALERLPKGDLRTRVDASVTWFLDVVSRHSTSWLAAVTARGMGGDADVERVLAEAEEVAADRMLVAVGLAGEAEHHEELRGMVRAYCGSGHVDRPRMAPAWRADPRPGAPAAHHDPADHRRRGRPADPRRRGSGPADAPG